MLLALAGLGLWEAAGAQGWGAWLPALRWARGCPRHGARLCWSLLPLAEAVAQPRSVPTAPLAAPSGGRGHGPGPGGSCGSWAWCWERPWSSPLLQVLLSLSSPLGSPSTWVGRYWQLWSCSLLSLVAHGSWPGQTCSAPCCPQHIPVPPLPCQDLLLPPAAPASAGVLSLGSGSGWVKGGRVLDGLCRNTCAVVAVLWWLPVPGEREGWLWLELCQAGKGLSPWGCVFVVPFTFLSCPRGAGPEPAEQPLRVPAVPLCHQQCPPVSLCVPHHNSSHCG